MEWLSAATAVEPVYAAYADYSRGVRTENGEEGDSCGSARMRHVLDWALFLKAK